MSSDLNHVSNCDQLSKMLGEVAVDVHGVKGRHKQEIWWWHKLWKIHSSLREVLFSLLSFFLLCRLMSLSKTAFQSLSTFRKGWNMNARRASVQFSAPCWMLKNCTKLDPPSPLQPHGCSSRSAVEVSSFLLGRGKGRDRMKKQIDSAIVFSRRYAKSIRYVYMLIMWRSQHYSDSPPEKEVMTSSRSEIFENWRVSNSSNKTGTNSRKSKR